MKAAHSMVPRPTVLSGVPQPRRRRSPDRMLSALIAGLIAFFVAKLSLAQPAYVQGHYESSLVPRHKMTVVYTDAQQAGDVNVVIVGWLNSFTQNIYVTDTNNNAYTVAYPMTSSSDGQLWEQIYIARNILPALPRANTVTVKFSSNITSDVRALEYSGVFSFPGGTAETGTGDWARSGNVTITQVPALLVAGTMVAPGSTVIGPTGGFSQRLLSPLGDNVEDRVITALTPPNTYNAGARLSPAGTWLMLMLGF
ncbi:MAG: hypothetical protein JOZ08_06550 [Verrucomicrobia bacterium]|nr:hypothetical protein [Verrucomicrobiota bacterium]